jgi:hypothetical protein
MCKLAYEIKYSYSKQYVPTADYIQYSMHII